MTQLTITDVRAIPGDSGFLLDNGTTAILCDSGFHFTADKIIEAIKVRLGGRPLDYILLTHSHYDHVLAVPQILAAWPNARIVAHRHAARILQKPSALARMRQLNDAAALQMGFPPSDQWMDRIPVNVPVEDGDRLQCGSEEIHVVSLPGHTRCSVGYYLPRHRLLLSAETLGVYFGSGICLPSFLVGYRMALDSIQRVRHLDPERMLLPHYGPVEGEETRIYLDRCRSAAAQTAGQICTLLRAGRSREEILAQLAAETRPQAVTQVYPMEAFRVNTSTMIDLIRSELLP